MFNFRFLGCLGGCLASIIFGGLILVVILVTVFSALFSSGGISAPGGIYGGDNTVTLAAKQMAAHLHDCRPAPGCSGYAAYDSGFPSDILAWGKARCNNCWEWQSGSFQCVSFVNGAFSRLRTLDFSGNGEDFAVNYSSEAAKALGYRFIPALSGLPLSPGDVMTWSGGEFGHVSVVLGWVAPKGNQAGQITFAQANAAKPIETLPILPDGRVDTANGYWNGFTVSGYIHPDWLPVAAPAVSESSTNTSIPNSPYVALAHAAAQEAGINPEYFVRQINRESGFNPTAISPAGAIGIAQFMPGTAAALGVDPYDPRASLRAAASYMKKQLDHYGGDYAKALAAYNAGGATVNEAISSCGPGWQACLPRETQNYLAAILE